MLREAGKQVCLSSMTLYEAPGELRELVGLEKRAMLVGQIHRFEIWSEAAWQAEQDQYGEMDLSAMPESVQKLAF